MIFSKTAIGYAHIIASKPCQDFSSAYSDEEKKIITCCDGHGGDIYIRSEQGSKFASIAVTKIFLEIEKRQLNKKNIKAVIEWIKLNVLCSWNQLVEQHLKENPIRKSEIEFLDSKQQDELKKNPIKAYGTTLAGVMQLNSVWVCIKIGDGEAFLLKRNAIIPVFSESDDEPVANVTYSMSEEEAYSHLHVAIYKANRYKGILLCTDGLSGPYRNYENFRKQFIASMLKKVKNDDKCSIEKDIEDLGEKYGLGDDVSIAFIID